MIKKSIDYTKLKVISATTSTIQQGMKFTYGTTGIKYPWAKKNVEPTDRK